jgi:hypothetical protein
LNPSLSVIGDTRATWIESQDPELDFHELEIAFVGPVNPYASAEVYLGIHGTSGIEVEEAKLLLDRYFPAGFGLTAGRYLIDFGQLNQIHLHAYPFVMRPLMYTEFFGSDGVVDTGVRLDWLAPTDVLAIRASAAAVRGDLFLGGHHHEAGAGEEETVDQSPKIGGTGRVELFYEPNENLQFAFGGSVMHGEFDTADGSKATWIGADLKTRRDLGPYRALILNIEAVYGVLDASEEVAASDPNGWFASADLRTGKRWNFGGFAESTTERFDDSVRTNRFGAFLGFALMEESTLFRIVGHVTDPQEGDPVIGGLVQVIFGLGPHRPHRY